MNRQTNRLLSLVVALLLAACSGSTPSTPELGTGVTRAPDGEYIGVSDGTFAFDTNRLDGALKGQAAEKLKTGDRGSALSLWQKAIGQDTNDAEALIYAEDQRVLASGRPYLTLVVGTMIGSGLPGSRDLQGAYVAQKEYNDDFKLPSRMLVRLLVANSGRNWVYAKSVAQQIVQAAKTDRTIVGVMGWPYSPQMINAVGTLAAAHIPMVTQMASSSQLTGISPYFFRVVPPDPAQRLSVPSILNHGCTPERRHYSSTRPNPTVQAWPPPSGSNSLLMATRSWPSNSIPKVNRRPCPANCKTRSVTIPT